MKEEYKTILLMLSIIFITIITMSIITISVIIFNNLLIRLLVVILSVIFFSWRLERFKRIIEEQSSGELAGTALTGQEKNG